MALTSSASAADSAERTTLVVHRDETASSCPDETSLVRAIDRVGTPPAVNDEREKSDLTLQVSFSRDETGRFTATVVASGRKNGTRVLTGTGDTCEPLTDALAVTLALLMDRELIDTGPSPSSAIEQTPPDTRNDKKRPEEPPPTNRTKTNASSTEADEPNSKPVERPTLSRPSSTEPVPSLIAASSSRTGGRLGGYGTYGIPGENFGWMLRGDLVHTRDWWQLRVGAFFTPDVRANFAGGTIDVSLAGGDVGACARVAGDNNSFAQLWGCGGLWLGRLRGSGTNYLENRSQNRPWYAISAAARLGGPIIGPVRWGIRLETLLTLQQETFSVDGAGIGFRASRGGLLLGPEVEVTIF